MQDYGALPAVQMMSVSLQLSHHVAGGRRGKRADKPVELIKLKGEDHYLSEPATRLECLEAVVGFINEHLDGRTG